jgi:surface protein
MGDRTSMASQKSGKTINNKNIRKFVRTYVFGNKDSLPSNLRGKKIGEWDVSQVTDMSNLFSDCINFNEDIKNWNVSNVESMEEMFRYCVIFNQDLSKWNVSNVINMYGMFFGCHKLTKNPNWLINEETDTEHMFTDTPLKNVVLKRVRYDINEANENIKHMIMSYNRLSKERPRSVNTKNLASLPEDIMDEITTFIDPDEFTQIVKGRKAKRLNKTSKKNSLSEEHPGGGGFTSANTNCTHNNCTIMGGKNKYKHKTIKRKTK